MKCNSSIISQEVLAILENIIANNLCDLRRTDKQWVHSRGGRRRGPIKRRPKRSNTWVESSDERMKGLPPIKSARSKREESQKRFPSDARCCAQISIRPRIGGTKGISDTPLSSLSWGIELRRNFVSPRSNSFSRGTFRACPRESNTPLDLLYIYKHNKSIARKIYCDIIRRFAKDTRFFGNQSLESSESLELWWWEIKDRWRKQSFFR